MTTWTQRLIGQLEFYWETHLLPRLQGLTDEEYFWEPATPCWSLRHDGDRWRFDHDLTPGPHAPVTTIAWRMTHLAVECLESRYRAFFAGEGPTMFAPGERVLAAGDLPGDAASATAYLAGAYQRWRSGIAGLSEAQLLAPLGPKGDTFAQFPMAELVLHLNREMMHHGGEICLLRDLYRERQATIVGSPVIVEQAVQGGRVGDRRVR